MNISHFVTDFGFADDEAYINRYEVEDEIYRNFNAPGLSPCAAYMITGLRGTGKTALMTHLSEHLGDEWLVVNVNSLLYPLKSIASALTAIPYLALRFQERKYDFSLLGIGVSITGGTIISDEEMMIRLMLKEIKDSKKKLLVTVDEVSNTEEMRQFAASFQIYRREKLPIYVIMTGLYHNISTLQEEKSITFLLRAKKLVLKNLDINMIARKYESLLSVDEDTSIKLAKITFGYPVAYSNLGDLYLSYNGDLDKTIAKLTIELQDRVYGMIWKNLSNGKKEFLTVMAESCVSTNAASVPVSCIVKNWGKSSSQVGEYKDALIDDGIIYSPERGLLQFSLPFFVEAILRFNKFN